jgi:hypothetical protein
MRDSRCAVAPPQLSVHLEATWRVLGNEAPDGQTSRAAGESGTSAAELRRSGRRSLEVIKGITMSSTTSTAPNVSTIRQPTDIPHPGARAMSRVTNSNERTTSASILHYTGADGALFGAPIGQLRSVLTQAGRYPRVRLRWHHTYIDMGAPAAEELWRQLGDALSKNQGDVR